MANGRKPRDRFLSVVSVLLAVLAVSNCTKALQNLRNPTHLGIVIFGVRFESVGANLVLGPVMGVIIGVYAWGLWKQRAWAAPLSMVYAFYVPLNLVLFWYRQTSPDIPPLAGLLGYLAVAFTGSIGTALYVAYHRDKLT